MLSLSLLNSVAPSLWVTNMRSNGMVSVRPASTHLSVLIRPSSWTKSLKNNTLSLNKTFTCSLRWCKRNKKMTLLPLWMTNRPLQKWLTALTMASPVTKNGRPSLKLSGSNMTKIILDTSIDRRWPLSPKPPLTKSAIPKRWIKLSVTLSSSRSTQTETVLLTRQSSYSSWRAWCECLVIIRHIEVAENKPS